jgi:hypothetical protein
MALQISYSKSETEIFPEAYAHIVSIISEAPKTYISVNIYESREDRLLAIARPATKEALASRPKPIYQIQYELNTSELPAGILWEVAYSYIKTLPLFSNGIDIIDPIVPQVQVPDGAVFTLDGQIIEEELQPTQPPAQA